MAARSHIRVASEGEKPPTPALPLTLVQAIEGGDYLEILLAQRREIAASLPDEKGPAKAALHRQLSIISKEITAMQLEADDEYSVVAATVDEVWDGTGY